MSPFRPGLTLMSAHIRHIKLWKPVSASYLDAERRCELRVDPQDAWWLQAASCFPSAVHTVHRVSLPLIAAPKSVESLSSERTSSCVTSEKPTTTIPLKTSVMLFRSWKRL